MEEIITPVVMDVFRNWIWDLIVSLYNWIDIYFSSIVQIGVINVFEDEFVSTLSTRMFALVGAFMVLKMAIVLIKYMTNPNAKEFNGGGAKIFGRFFAVVLLMALAPSFFSVMKKIQNGIVVSLPQLFVVSGVTSEIPFAAETMCEYTVTTGGMKYTKTVGSGGTACADSLEIPGLESAYLNSLYTEFQVTDYYRHIISKNINKTFMAPTFETANKDAYWEMINEGDYNSITVYISERIPVTGEQISGNTADAGITKDVYILRFDWILSLIVTIVAFALIIYALFQLVVRSLKLAFLQILSPIPILSYLDPSAEWSDGVSVPSKFLKAYFITYVDVFIRMSVVIVVMMGIDVVDQMTLLQADSVIKLFLLLSLLASLIVIPNSLGNIFAKDGVKLLDAVSIKSIAPGSSVGTSSTTNIQSGGNVSTTNSLETSSSTGTNMAKDVINNNKAKELSSTMNAGQFSTGKVEKNSLTSGAGLRTNTNFDTASTQAKSMATFNTTPSMSVQTPEATVNIQGQVHGTGYTQKKDVTPYKSRGDASKTSPSTPKSGKAVFQKTVNNNYNTTNNYNYEDAQRPANKKDDKKG